MVRLIATPIPLARSRKRRQIQFRAHNIRNEHAKWPSDTQSCEFGAKSIDWFGWLGLVARSHACDTHRQFTFHMLEHVTAEVTPRVSFYGASS